MKLDFNISKMLFWLSWKEGRVKLASLLAILSMVLAMVVLSTTQSVITGVREAFFKSILGFNAHLVLMDAGDEQFTNDLKEQVQAAGAYLYLEGMLAGGGKNEGVVVKGVDPENFDKVYDVSLTDATGLTSFSALLANFKSTEAMPVILGKALAVKLGADKVGSVVKLFLPAKSAPKDKRFSNFTRMVVAGFFESGYYDYDSRVMLLPLQQLQNLIEAPDKITGTELRLKDPWQVDSFAVKLRAHLGENVRLITWQELNGEIFAALKLEQGVFALIMGALVFIACFNLLGVMLLIIYERKRELAILQTLGLSQQRLKKIFMQVALLISFIGIVCGVVASLLSLWLIRYKLNLPIYAEVYMLPKIPIVFSAMQLASVAAFTLLLAVVSAALALLQLKQVKIGDVV